MVLFVWVATGGGNDDGESVPVDTAPSSQTHQPGRSQQSEQPQRSDRPQGSDSGQQSGGKSPEPQMPTEAPASPSRPSLPSLSISIPGTNR